MKYLRIFGFLKNLNGSLEIMKKIFLFESVFEFKYILSKVKVTIAGLSLGQEKLRKMTKVR